MTTWTCELCGHPIDDDLVLDDDSVEPTCRACDRQTPGHPTIDEAT